MKVAKEFAAEVAGTAERKKKPLPSADGLQTFLLYVRAGGKVPPHQVSGAISVQTLIGRTNFSVSDQTYNLPTVNVILVGRGLQHSLSADEETVLLVSHALVD